MLVREAPGDTKTKQANAIALDCPPGLDGKTQLENKNKNTLVAGQRKETGTDPKISLCCVAFTMPKGAMQTTGGENKWQA